MKKNFGILLFFVTLILVLYYPTSNGGFAADFVGWKDRFDAGSWADLPHCFGYHGLHQFFHLFFYSFYKSFGINGFWWYLVFSLGHSINALLLFSFLKKLLHYFQFDSKEIPAFLAAMLFLVCPYQSEVLVWKVCFHYLLSTGLILSCLILLTPKSEKVKIKIGWPMVFFSLSLFVLEISIITPLLVFCLLLLFQKELKTNIKILLPFFLILGGYFFLNKMILGAWVGHYGEEKHLNTDFLLIFGNELRYFFKNLVFSRYLPGTYKTAIFNAFGNSMVVWPIVAGLFTLAGVFLFYLKKINPRWLLAGVFFAMFLIAILPIANLYHAYELTTENDRYGYFASAFFYPLLVVTIYGLPQAARYVLIGIYLILGFLLTKQNVENWHHANRIHTELLNNYRWDEYDNVYVLAAPDNYEGIFFFKNFAGRDLVIKEELNALSNRNIKGNIIPIGQFTMRKPTDKVEVKVNKNGVITVKFAQWGNWWMHNGIGAKNRETDLYSYKIINNGYELRFKKNLPPDTKLIYSNGGQWREIAY